MSKEMIVPQTGEIVNAVEVEDLKVAPLSFQLTSTLSLSDTQRKRLMEKIPVDDLDILPTGEVYASQIRYRNTLNAAFGPGAWGLVPISPLAIKDNQVYREYALMVYGITVSTAIGEQAYHPNNSRMTYATAAEAAKSNALTRCCKDLGIASECWDRKFCQEFKKDHCIEVYRTEKRKNEWRRKDATPFYDEGRHTGPQKDKIVEPVGNQELSIAIPEVPNDYVKDPTISASMAAWKLEPITEAQRKRFYAIAKSSGKTDKQIHDFLLKEIGTKESKEIHRGVYELLCEKVGIKDSMFEGQKEDDEDVPF